MKISPLLASVTLFAGVGGLVATPAFAEVTPIVVLSAVFGPVKSTRPADFTVKLRETCGASANYCQAFCSRAAVGDLPLGKAVFIPPRMVCRVTYRCGALLTKVSEADENDTFSLSCRSHP